MKINVLEINKYSDDKTLITFSSPYGSAYGFFMERNPEINKSYDVEFDIPQTLVWGKDIKKTDSKEYKIYQEQDAISICAMFHAFDDTGCLTLRFGDSLILIETEGVPILNDGFLTISFKTMNIFPYTL